MRTRGQSAFSLIEMIVVLAIVAILLGTLAVSFIKRMDRLAAEKETANLKKLAAAFKKSVEANRYIPSAGTWVSTVAAQLGWQANQVSANERQIARVLLIDPYMQVGANSVGGPILPYPQPIGGSAVTNGAGSVIRPPNPRFMIISTIGSALPGGVVSGIGATNGANSFSNIWVTADGAVPAGWTFGDGNDLKIARIDLSDLFIPLTIWNYDSARIPFYGADALTTNSVTFTSATPPPAYFIRGTELKLYGDAGLGNLQYSEIIYTGHDFAFELGAWTMKAYIGRTTGTPFGKDLQRALNLFMRAPANPLAGITDTTANVRAAMTEYMNAFIDWRDHNYEGEGCPGPAANNAYTTRLEAASALLATKGDGLIKFQ